MKFENLTTAPPDGMTRVSAFTLATALVWMGHDCRGGCPPLVAQLRASVWSDRSLGVGGSEQTSAMLLVDFGDQVWRGPSADGLLHQVNQCTRPDHTQVQLLATWTADAIELGHRDCALCVNGIDHDFAFLAPARASANHLT